jgi:peptidoglycan hydrolase-like amidase
MSQYGARGAAAKGLSYRKILAFYYPGTKLVTQKAHHIRIRLSGTGTATTIHAYPHTVVTGVSGVLATKNIKRYRLIAGKGTTLTLQRLGTAAGAKWTTVKTGLPNGAAFHRTNWAPQRLFHPDGSAIAYLGTLQAVRSGSGVYTVDIVKLDRYTQGVVPREMPASWQRAAVDAQAVAARTYAEYAVQHPRSANYDICDTTACQVYGGHVRYDRGGHPLWTDYPPAASDTARQVLTYKGSVAFTQFSASNGGWMVSGGQPYLVAKADPYDTAKLSGDPYIPYTITARVSRLASYFKLHTVTKIAITKRDGHGQWGGRALAGYVTGTDSANHAKTVSFTGFDLQYALGIGTTWVSLHSAA